MLLHSNINGHESNPQPVYCNHMSQPLQYHTMLHVSFTGSCLFDCYDGNHMQHSVALYAVLRYTFTIHNYVHLLYKPTCIVSSLSAVKTWNSIDPTVNVHIHSCSVIDYELASAGHDYLLITQSTSPFTPRKSSHARRSGIVGKFC